MHMKIFLGIIDSRLYSVFSGTLIDYTKSYENILSTLHVEVSRDEFVADKHRHFDDGAKWFGIVFPVIGVKRLP